ncbi:transposase [Vibrio breoganii]
MNLSRPLRLEFAGALYHVTARGNERNWIFFQDDDFTLYLTVLDEVCERYNWVIHAYCLMSNHYHLLLETPDGNLSKAVYLLRRSIANIIESVICSKGVISPFWLIKKLIC